MRLLRENRSVSVNFGGDLGVWFEYVFWETKATYSPSPSITRRLENLLDKLKKSV